MREGKSPFSPRSTLEAKHPPLNIEHHPRRSALFSAVVCLCMFFIPFIICKDVNFNVLRPLRCRGGEIEKRTLCRGINVHARNSRQERDHTHLSFERLLSSVLEGFDVAMDGRAGDLFC